MIYFIRDGRTDRVKIGRSKRPRRRLAALQTGVADMLALLREIDGGAATERWLHEHFASLRLRGEWFRYSDEMMTIEPPQGLEAPKTAPKSPLHAAIVKWIGEGRPYSAPQAAQIAGVSTQVVYAWLNGTCPRGPALVAMWAGLDPGFFSDCFEGQMFMTRVPSETEMAMRANALRKVAEGMAELRQLG